MRYVLIASAVLIAIPAIGQDDEVPRSTLDQLGLGELQVMSETESTQVRGRCWLDVAFEESVIPGLVFDPWTGNYLAVLDASFRVASSNSVGPRIASHSDAKHGATAVVISLTSTEILVASLRGLAVGWSIPDAAFATAR
jgi:hypothetical protein